MILVLGICTVHTRFLRLQDGKVYTNNGLLITPKEIILHYMKIFSVQILFIFIHIFIITYFDMKFHSPSETSTQDT